MKQRILDSLKDFGKKAFLSVKDELLITAGFVALICIAFVLSAIFPLNDYFAIMPRKLRGLPGIIAMPFLHKDLQHLLSNVPSLFILLALMAGSRVNTWKIVGTIILASGTLLWLAGFSATSYVGASMLIFGLIGFLIPAGFLEKRPIPMIISVFVGVFYFWTVIWGLIPTSAEVSELAHFYGAITGVALAFLLARAPGAATATEQESPLETASRESGLS